MINLKMILLNIPLTSTKFKEELQTYLSIRPITSIEAVVGFSEKEFNEIKFTIIGFRVDNKIIYSTRRSKNKLNTLINFIKQYSNKLDDEYIISKINEMIE